MGLQEDIKELNAIYKSVPSTKCIKLECGDWCCSRLSGFEDESGNFISLPMMYSIEYQNIREHLKNNSHCKNDCQSNARSTEKLCLFRNSAKSVCDVYPVRPFSCRVYGRKVPPVFWGQRVSEDMAANIYCKNCVVKNEETENAFLLKYSAIWDKLAELSLKNPFLSGWKQEVFKEITGLDNIVIFGWREFKMLEAGDRQWYETKLKEFWDIYGKLM